LAYADDVNLLGDNIDTIKKNTENLIDVSKEVGLEINVEKTKYMFLSRHQNVGQNWDIFFNDVMGTFQYVTIIVNLNENYFWMSHSTSANLVRLYDLRILLKIS
jgi:hypothetical protein